MKQLADRFLVIICLLIISYLLGVVFTMESGDYLEHLGIVTSISAVVGVVFIMASFVAAKLQKALISSLAAAGYWIAVIGAIGYIIFWFGPAC